MGFLDRNKSSSKQITNVNTTTTTTIRDVGVTGAHAVSLAKNAGDQGVRIAQIGADVVRSAAQESGYQFRQLVGGAGELLRRSSEASQREIGSAQEQARLLVSSAKETAARLAPADSDLTKWALFAVAGVAGIMLLVRR